MPKNEDAPEAMTDAVEVAGAAAEIAEEKTETFLKKVEAEAAAVVHPVEAEIERWFQDLRANLQGLETEAHNKLFNAKEALKQRLRGLIA